MLQAPSAPAPSIGTLPDSFCDRRYRVVRRLGEGASKIVYLAHDQRFDRDVAFAVFKVQGLDAQARARIASEARAVGRLSGHPHIVDVYDAGEESGLPYMVSQYVAGGSVEQLLESSSRHRLTLQRALHIAQEVCQALARAHSLGIIHRDLKPGNVFLTPDGEVKLGDFGIALMPDQSRVTLAGMVIGTIAYMSPEQLTAEPVGPASDLYSFGVMLYEMLTGTRPFVGDTASLIAQHLSAVPVPPSLKSPDVPPVLDNLVLKLLAKNPVERPTPATAVADSLGRIASSPDASLNSLASTLILERPDVRAQTAPDGTVSILFSDLQDSTRLFESMGDLRAQTLMRAHNAIVRGQVAANKGYEVKSTGDGFMVAFSSARRAALCAIGIQREMATYRMQHPSEPLHVRIGLHVGEAIAESGDFFGKAVIVAARICAQAGADEVLVSSTFRELTQAAGDLQYEAGEQMLLKGLAASYQVHKMVWRDARGASAGATVAPQAEPACPRCGRTLPPGAQVCSSCKTEAVSAVETGRPTSPQHLRRLITASAALALLVVAVLFYLIHRSSYLPGGFGTAAAAGDPEAQIHLGRMYENGLGVPRDYRKAMKWYRKAAEQGNADGEVDLGHMYETSEGVAQDYTEAFKWYRKAAEQGSPWGENNLGWSYEEGHAVAQDHAEALRWFQKAADQGNARGEASVGYMYETGHAVPQDYNQALTRYRASAEQGDTWGEWHLGQMYEKGEGVPQNYAEALKWYRKAAEQGDSTSEIAVGHMYEKGLGVPQGYAQALKWYLKAAGQGSAPAEENVGRMYEHGLGVPADQAEAMKWYSKAAGKGVSNLPESDRLGLSP
jgi:TPR repeat protein/serine/threonine protein kinase